MRIIFRDDREPERTRGINVEPWFLIETGLKERFRSVAQREILLKDPEFRQKPVSWFMYLRDENDPSIVWEAFCLNEYIPAETWWGIWLEDMDILNNAGYIVFRLTITAEQIDEWRIYQIDLEGNEPPQRLEGKRGDANFDEATGIIEISVQENKGSRAYVFRPEHPCWPRPYLEGWTEVKYLRDRLGELCEQQLLLRNEKTELEEAIAEAIEELNGLIGDKAMESILNPLAVLFRPNKPAIQHCGAEIKAKLEAVRARLQPQPPASE